MSFKQLTSSFVEVHWNVDSINMFPLSQIYCTLFCFTGYVIYRVRIRRGGRKRPVPKGATYGKPTNQGVNQLKNQRSLQAVAEVRYWVKCFGCLMCTQMFGRITNFKRKEQIAWKCFAKLLGFSWHHRTMLGCEILTTFKLQVCATLMLWHWFCEWWKPYFLHFHVTYSRSTLKIPCLSHAHLSSELSRSLRRLL